MERRVHLIGIGGMHMSAIAQLLLAEGVAVSGSDLVMSSLTRRLEGLGATVFSGHAAGNVGDATLVVATAAVKGDNAEIVEARRRGVPVIPRHEMVARLMEGRTAIAVAGTHGKTTTSSLIAYILRAAGHDPTYLLGGESIDLAGNAAAGAGNAVVVEADEYAGAFLAYHPAVAVVTNIEADHLDYYRSEACLRRAFLGFLGNVESSGRIFACADSPILREAIGSAGSGLADRAEWYGLGEDAGWRGVDITLRVGGGSSFAVSAQGRRHGPMTLRVPGLHNVSNAIAAFAVVRYLGVPDSTVVAAMASFQGARRRFEVRGEAAGITIIDDYAHHPTEIAATLAAARSRYPERRIVALFQPHTYSRTRYLLEGFRSCFAGADRLILLQTFAARETADAGMDAVALARELPSHPEVLANLGEAVSRLVEVLKPGDVCFTMGAGDVTNVGPALLEALNHQ